MGNPVQVQVLLSARKHPEVHSGVWAADAGLFAEAAQKLFIYSANKQFEGYVTAKSVTDIYYLTHRITHSDAETRKILSKLFTLFHLLDTTSLDCRKAISSEIGDYEDAIMVETAIRSETFI